MKYIEDVLKKMNCKYYLLMGYPDASLICYTGEGEMDSFREDMGGIAFSNRKMFFFRNCIFEEESSGNFININTELRTPMVKYLVTNDPKVFERFKSDSKISFKNPYDLLGKHTTCSIERPAKSQQQEYFFIDKAETMKYLQGQDITISCEVDGDVELESGGVLFQYQLEGQDTYTDVKAEVTTSSTGKKRIWVRVKLP